MTRKERVFRHIEDNGNAMRYTDIIKFAYEDKYGKDTFNKINHRGFYACAFTYHSYWSSRNNDRIKNVGRPKGHFVIRTKNGNLFKLSNGLWSVHRPLGWTRNNDNCETYENRIIKFLGDGKEVVERDIVMHIKPGARQYGLLGYDWGSTNNLLRKMINSGKVYRISLLNERTGRFAYHYGLVDTAIQSTTSRELDNKIKRSTKIVENLETGITIIPKEEYDNMCDVLAKYNISAYTLDNLATDYFSEGKTDAVTAYHTAFYDLLPENSLVKSTLTDNLKKVSNESKDYLVTSKVVPHFKEIFSKEGLISYFSSNIDPKNYSIFEIGKEITIEKKITTTVTIK